MSESVVPLDQHWAFEKCGTFGMFPDASGIASRNDDAQALVLQPLLQVSLDCGNPPIFRRQVKPLCSLDMSQPRSLRLQVRQRCGDDKSIADAHWNIGDRHSVEGSLEMPTEASLLHD